MDLERFRVITLLLKESIEHGQPGEAEIAKTELEGLVEEYAIVFGYCVAPQQLDAAKRDPEYFLRLIDVAWTNIRD